MPTTLSSMFSASWKNYGSLVKSSLSQERKKDVQNDLPTKCGDKRVSDKVVRLFNLGLMSLVLMGFGMCSSLFAPFFPTEAARRGVSATTVGLIFGSFTLVMFIGSLAAGRLVRTLGPTFMIWSGTLLAGGSTILFGLLDQAPPGRPYVTLCFLVRLVEGVGGSLYNTAAFSIVAVLYPQTIATNYAVLETASGLGRMIGPTLGGVLFNLGGFSLPFYIVGLMLLVFGFISMTLLSCTMPVELANDLNKSSDSSNSETSADSPPPLSWSHFYRVSPEIWILTITLAIASVILGYPQPTMALYFEQLGLTDALQVGLIFLAGSLAYTFMALISGKLADSFPKSVYQMMAIAAVVISVGSLLSGPAPPLQHLLRPSIALSTGCFIVVALAMAMIINPAPSAIIDAARSAGYQDGLDTSAMVASLYNAMWYLGSFAGTPIAGFLMDCVGFEWGACVMAVLALFIAILLVVGAFIRKCKTAKLARPPPDYVQIYGSII